MKLDAQVARLRADIASGASVVVRRAVEIVRRAAGQYPSESTEEFRRLIAALCIQIVEAQPAMAPLVTLSCQILNSLREEMTLDEARYEISTVARSFEEGVIRAVDLVAERSDPLLSQGATLLTISSSTTVLRALEQFCRVRSINVICLESRPVAEGARLARRLSEAGIQTTVAVDAAMGSLLQEVDLVLLGADSLGDKGLVNKVGSLPLTSLAQGLGVPVYCLMDTSKILPPAFPQEVEDDRPEEEVLKDPEGVKVWNRYFEVVPLEEITLIVTEDGAKKPAELQELRAVIPVPPELRAWANARGF